MPKTVLKQIYEQMINKTTADNQAEPVAQLDQSEDKSSQTMLNRDNMETNLVTVTSDSASGQTNTLIDSVTSGTVTSESSNNDVYALLVQNTLGMMTSMQTAISTLQSTVNTLITKQSVSGLETKNNLDKFYNAIPVTSEQQAVQPVTPMSKTNSGVAADELPHIDVVTDSVKRNIITGKYINLACLLIPDFEAPKASMMI